MRNGDTAGKRHPDTVDCFAQSSFFEAFPGIEEPKMKRFTLYHDNKCVFGFEQTFHNLKAKEDLRYKDRPVSMGQFVGCHIHAGFQESFLDFEEGEQISHVVVRSGDIVDNVAIHTTKGRVLSGGGNGGEEKTLRAANNVPILGLSCGMGGHVHNVKIMFIS